MPSHNEMAAWRREVRRHEEKYANTRTSMTVKELRERLACEPDDAVVEVYREKTAVDADGANGPAVLRIVGVDGGYDVGPTGAGAVVFQIAL